MRLHRLTFQTKILLPVVLGMVLSATVTLWIFNRHISRQTHAAVADTLTTADAVFRNSQTIREKELLLRYANIPNEPRFKAVSQLGEPKTMRFLLNELITELGVDLLQYTTADGQTLATAIGEQHIDTPEFSPATALLIRRAIDGQPAVGVTPVGDKLFEVVSVPVRISNRILGALTIATDCGAAVANDFHQLTHSEVVFLAAGRVVASTLRHPGLVNRLEPGAGPQPFEVDGTHYLARVGRFNPINNRTLLVYVLLVSYEPSLVALRTTQNILLGVGVLGIGVAVLVTWAFVRRVTQPLRQLRDSAEAIGRGDFSQRLPVVSRDECGELASAFNHMTENLRTSRDELESTVANLQKTKAQLTQSEKLSVIGEFVAGVAHELNNPLASVVGFAQLMQRTEVAPQQGHFLDRIAREAQRCRKIVQNLLSFARQHQTDCQRVNLNDLVHAAAEILEYQLRTSNIAVTMDLDNQLPAVRVDVHQIQQVFINLLNNARQAIEAQRSAGQITVVTRASGDHVCVQFCDDGPGITEEDLKKLFTPFFTTKEVGKGTGLGLSLCYGIIHEHGGQISATSKPGEGARFTIELPIATGPDDAPVQPDSATPVLTVGDGRGKRVLVVDDEEALRDLMSEILVADSYDVDTASDGEAALRKTRGTRYDLIVCDWKMPGLNGMEFFEQLRATDPQAAARFIFLTGDVVGAQKLIGSHGNRCLGKPFSLDELRAAVSSAFQPSKN